MPNPKAERLLVRRLWPEEAALIKGLQPPDLIQHYPKHASWLDRAITEIRTGSRIAFGAFSWSFEERKPVPKLVGSVLIKKGGYSDEIELKNLTALSLPGQSVNTNDIRRKLIDKAERFCEGRGFRRVETELPGELTDEINFFLRHKYKILTARESRYRAGSLVYVLSRELTHVYSGDPFDSLSIARWLLYELFEFERTSDPETRIPLDSSIGSDYHDFYFEIAPRNIPGRVKSAVASSARINGRCFVDLGAAADDRDHRKRLIEDLANSRADLKVFFTDDGSEDIRRFAETKGVKYFNRNAVRQLLGESSTPNRLPFDQGEIGGMFLELDQQKYSGRLEQLKIVANKPMAYLISGGSGAFVLSHEDDIRTVAFVSPCMCGTELQPAIWACATIDEVEIASPREAYQRVEKQQTLLEVNEYQFVVNENFLNREAHKIVVLSLINPIVLQSPIPIAAVASVESRQWLEKELGEYGIPTCYIDAGTIKQLHLNESYRVAALPKMVEQGIGLVRAVLASQLPIPTKQRSSAHRLKAEIRGISGTAETDVGVAASLFSAVEAAMMFEIDADARQSDPKHVLVRSAYDLLTRSSALKGQYGDLDRALEELRISLTHSLHEDGSMLSSLLDALRQAVEVLSLSAAGAAALRKLGLDLSQMTGMDGAPIDAQSPLNLLIDAETAQLTVIVGNYRKLVDDQRYGALEKDMERDRLSAQAAHLLKRAEPLKRWIKNYDDWLSFFQASR